MNELKTYLGALSGKGLPVVERPTVVPCIETSDAERLCRHPLVSVRMVTFNHEPFVRQAIESVMMQEADFEFELVIGEDASTDRTREICFELQRKYPDRIRVLWSEENLFAYDGNAYRVQTHCRGEYVAFLEGDDYWTDPKKLQKQVALLRATGSVGCFAWRRDLLPDGTLQSVDSRTKPFLDNADLFGHYYHTCTYLYHRAELDLVVRRYPSIGKWYDTQLSQCIACEGKICMLPEEVAVYRITGAGVASSLKSVHERLVLTLRQSMPMYLYGPTELRLDYANLMLRELAQSAYPLDPSYDTKRFAADGKLVYALFFRLFFRHFPSRMAMRWLVRLLKYRTFDRIVAKRRKVNHG